MMGKGDDNSLCFSHPCQCTAIHSTFRFVFESHQQSPWPTRLIGWLEVRLDVSPYEQETKSRLIMSGDQWTWWL